MNKNQVSNAARADATGAFAQTGRVNDLDRGTRADRPRLAISGRSAPRNAPKGRKSPPPDLAGFLATRPVSEIADALQTSRGTAHRLAHGYWPQDDRKLGDAWARYTGRAALRTGAGWFLRRVRDGAVMHGGSAWRGAQLAAQEGELVALACAADGKLLAQTLELPPERFTLARITNA